MRAAIISVAAFVVIVAGLFLVAVDGPVQALGPGVPLSSASEAMSPTGDQTTPRSLICPDASGGPSLSGCPDGSQPSLSKHGFGDLRVLAQDP
jgi:hypothetical protein